MTVRIFSDIEEAISREVRRISFQDQRTPTYKVLKNTFDPITGSVISLPVEANYYDSSANTRSIQYPHIFVKLLRTQEDTTSGRIVPQYGLCDFDTITTSPQAYTIIMYLYAGLVDTSGNILVTTTFKIRRIHPGYLLRILSGANKGTYTISAVTPQPDGNHEIEVSNIIVNNLPALNFVTATRTIVFSDIVDLNTVKITDIFTDSLSNSYNITTINIDTRSITVDGVSTPNLLIGGNINRSGDVFVSTGSVLSNFSILDPTQPIIGIGNHDGSATFTSNVASSPPVPINIYYMVRIDSKERQTHIQILNRIWEEFNPPRTGLPTIVRTKLSADEELTVDVPLGGSDTISVLDNSKYSINDPIFVFDNLVPTKAVDGQGFTPVFASKVINLIGTTQIQLADIVPETFKISNHTKIVSNAALYILLFNMVDHVTKDVEGAQYWVHEITFLVQAWIDRQGEPVINEGVVQKISFSGEDFIGNIIIKD